MSLAAPASHAALVAHYAAVRARLSTQRAGTLTRTFRLVRDPATSLWKIADVEL